MRRKLIAILFADIAGYSQLMARDESGTHEEFKRRLKQSLRPAIARCKGRLVKMLGDGFLVAYDSPVNAVECAVSFQKEMIAQNLLAAPERQLHFRIGVHLGDIIEEGKDIVGDGVNIAERIQSLAEPDGILISLAVHEQVDGKMSVAFRDLGAHAMKNMARPVRVFAVVSENGGPKATSRTLGKFGNSVVAVLPFMNMSADPEQQYFGDGMAEDVITGLSRFRMLSVISRQTSFAYRDMAVDVKSIAEAIGAQFVVEGSVRKLGSRVRITTQLINAETRHHVWADQYDVEVSDIFSVQDDVTRRIVGSIVPKIELQELEIARRRPTGQPRAYDYYLRGKASWHAAYDDHDAQAMAEARRFFEEAIIIDPEFADAYNFLARIDNNLTMYSKAGTAVTPLRERAWHNAQKAIALDEAHADAQLTMAWCYLWRREFVAARKHLDLSSLLNPYDADLAVDRGTTFMYLGEPEIAIGLIMDGIRLNPFHPDSYLGDLAEAYFVAKRYEDMLAVAESVPNPSPRFAAWKAAGYAHAGRMEKAAYEGRRFVQNVRAIWAGDPNAGVPEYVEWLRSFSPFRRLEDWNHLVSGLRLAGLAIP